MLWRDSWRSNAITTISTGGMFLSLRTSLSECSLIQINFRGIFTHISSSSKWGQTRMEFLTLTRLKTSGETTNTVVLITNGVREGELGMVTGFCHPSQAKMEACEALSTLCQSNSLEPRVMVVRRHSNTPYFPRGHLIHFTWTWALSRWCFLNTISVKQAVFVQVSSC